MVLQGPLRTLFDPRSILTDVSGAGNNWAHGYHIYGPQYQDQILEMIRYEAEQCDSLQGFFLMHSLGGGTGSGLGSYLLTLLQVWHGDSAVLQLL
jgi:tubulin epsilon